MSEQETLRDTFAAAALTGLIERRPWPVDKNESATICYQFADAMLRERLRNRAPDARETVQPTLTDAERGDIEMWRGECIQQAREAACDGDSEDHDLWIARAERIAALLARMGGGA